MAIPEKIQTTGVGVEDMEFPEIIEERACGNSRAQEKPCGISTGLIFDLGISTSRHTILQNFQGCKLWTFKG